MPRRKPEIAGASAAPSKAKVQAMVRATEISTGKTVYLVSKLGSVLMSTPSAYDLAKRRREHPTLGVGWLYAVELVKPANQ